MRKLLLATCAALMMVSHALADDITVGPGYIMWFCSINIDQHGVSCSRGGGSLTYQSLDECQSNIRPFHTSSLMGTKSDGGRWFTKPVCGPPSGEFTVDTSR